MKFTRRFKVILALLIGVPALGSLFLMAPVRLAGLVLIGHSPQCTFARAVASEDHKRRLAEATGRILKASRLLETDSSGMRHWQT